MQAQVRAEKSIRGFPSGWSIQRFFQNQQDPRSCVVLCERTVTDGLHGTKYVVWWVNDVEGGCFHGLYTDDAAKAGSEYNRRVSTQRFYGENAGRDA